CQARGMRVCSLNPFCGLRPRRGLHRSSPYGYVANTIAHVLSSSMLASLTSQCRDKCQHTISRFLGAVPRYPLVWVVLSYSRVATGAFWDTLLVVASGAPYIRSPLVPHSLIQR